MSRLRAIFHRLGGLVPRAQREDDLRAELETHIAMHTEDNLREGMSPEEARRQAILALGGLEQTSQAYRDQTTFPLLDHLMQDLRFALRQLRRAPGFTVTAVCTLALGIAAAIAIFSFVDAALLRPLPYKDPARLLYVTESVQLIPAANLSMLDFQDWKNNTSLSSLDVIASTPFGLSSGGRLELVGGARVSDGFFRTLGVRPILGRDFYAGEDKPTAQNSVIITHGAWQEHFGKNPSIIGSKITLNDNPYTVVGVLPETFSFPPRGAAEFFTPLGEPTSCEKRRSCHNLVGIGRLKDGVSAESARANFVAIAAELERRYPDSNRGQGAYVVPLTQFLLGDIRPILLTLMGGAALLLLIACVNVSSLLLVRAESRRREVAVRGALGASRLRLTRQFITEAVLLTVCSTALGSLAAVGAMQLLLHLLSKDMLVRMPYLANVSFSSHAAAFVLLIAFLAAILFSCTTVLRLSTGNMRDDLAEGSRGSGGRFWRRLGANLVVLELATAVVLLVGAGLLGKSFYRLLHVELGFNPSHLATLQVALPKLSYPKDAQQIAAAQQIMQRVSALPGVQSVGLTTLLPVTGNGNTSWIRFVGRPYDGHHIEINDRDVSPSLFSTLQTRLLHGRLFTDEDDASHPRVAIVNQAFVRKYFPGEDPIGKVMGNPVLAPETLFQIVGVVDDLREASLDDETAPTRYMTLAQDASGYFNLIARVSQPEETILPSMRAAIRAIDPTILVFGDTTELRYINDSPTASLHRAESWLIGGFAALALLLGVVGLYGVIAYSVSQRTREIGVRMALGAQRGTVYSMVLREAGRLTAFGILGGILCAVATATLMRSLLFGTAAWDAATLATVSLLLGTAALFASFLPARRAASVNPVEALRAE